MNSKIWIDWLTRLDQRMKNEKRKIILLADNAPCHFSNDNMTNVKLHFLPPNTTSHIQPLDASSILLSLIIRGISSSSSWNVSKRIQKAQLI